MIKLYSALFFVFFFLVIGCRRIVDPVFSTSYRAFFVTNTLNYTIYAEALFLPLTNNNVDGIWEGSNYVSYSAPVEILPGEMKQVMDYMIPNMLKIYKENTNNEALIFYREDFHDTSGYLDSSFYILQSEYSKEIRDDRYLEANAPFSYMPLGFYHYGDIIYDLETRKKWFRYSNGRAFIECIALNKYKDIFNK